MDRKRIQVDRVLGSMLNRMNNRVRFEIPPAQIIPNDPRLAVVSGSGSKHWYSTNSDLVDLSATWTIENARLHLSPLAFMESPEFSSPNGNQKWRICVDKHQPSSFVKVFVKLNSADLIQAVLSFAILASGGQHMYYKKSTTVKFKGEFSYDFGAVDDPAALLRQQNLLTNDALKLYCKIQVKTLEPEARAVKFNLPESDPLLAMLCDGHFADVAIVVEGQELLAHKCILAANSVVFRAMFDCAMEESTQNRVVIPDLSYVEVEQMLQFVYTGAAPELQTMAERLLMVADRYALERFKVKCEEVLYGSLTVDNAVKLLTLAELYSANQLKQHVEQFIGVNIMKVRDSAGWKEMLAENVARECRIKQL